MAKKKGVGLEPREVIEGKTVEMKGGAKGVEFAAFAPPGPDRYGIAWYRKDATDPSGTGQVLEIYVQDDWTIREAAQIAAKMTRDLERGSRATVLDGEGNTVALYL